MNIPDFCYALNNMTIHPETNVGQVIKIKAMEKGYYPTNLLMTQEQVDEKNRELGVEKHVAEAMSIASMFGWDTYNAVLQSLAAKWS